MSLFHNYGCVHVVTGQAQPGHPAQVPQACSYTRHVNILTKSSLQINNHIPTVLLLSVRHLLYHLRDVQDEGVSQAVRL
jgi:hypothetical protein